MSLPLVTYILCAYNHEMFVEEALESAFNQDYKGRIQYVLLDDGSIDKTHDIMLKIKVRYPDLWIDDLWDGVNRGLVKNLNRAIQVACGDILIFHSCDDVAKRNRVLTFVDAFLRDETLMVCSFCVEDIDSEGRLLHSDRWFHIDETGFVEPSIALPYFYGCNEGVRRDFLMSFGGFEETFGGAEDMQLILMGKLCGKIKTFPDKTLKYRRHNSNWIGHKYETLNWVESYRRQARRAMLFDATNKSLWSILSKARITSGATYNEVANRRRVSSTYVWAYCSIGAGWGNLMICSLSARLKFHLLMIRLFGRWWYCFRFQVKGIFKGKNQ